MAEAKRDENRVTTLIAVSEVDQTTPVNVWADPTTHELLTKGTGGGGGGDVNLTEVGGVAIALGQTTMASSLPVAIASDQTWTGATNLGKATDAVAGASDVGVAPLAIRDDVLTTITPADGDYTPLKTGEWGDLWVSLATKLDSTNDSVSAVSSGNVASGASDSGNPVKVGGRYNSTKPTLTDGQRGDVQLGTRGSVAVSLFQTDSTNSPIGATGATAPSAAFYLGGLDSGGAMQGVRLQSAGDAQSSILGAAGYVYNGTNSDRLRSVINATNSTGTGIMAAGILAQFDDVSPTAITENQFGNLRMSANRNMYTTIRDAAGNERGLNVDANGAIAIGSVVAGTGATNLGKAEDGAHTSGDTGVMDLAVRNDTMADFTGADNDYTPKSVTVKGQLLTANAPRARKLFQVTTITASTSETTVLTAAASTFHDVYGVIVTNTSATATEVAFKDATAGTTRFTISAPANDTRGFMLPIDAAHNQAAVNGNWTATCADSVSSILITIFAVKNV